MGRNLPGTPPSAPPPQVFNECAQVRNTVGIDNPGIAADVARRMHHEQGIYE